MEDVAVAHRETRNWSDKVALFAVKVLRWGLDTVSGYRHDKAKALHAKDPAAAQQKYGMTEQQYLTRNIFLESVAGVPGMVAGMLRHLHSMRRMKRDHGWIETLLEESYNERMHLLIFLKVRYMSDGNEKALTNTSNRWANLAGLCASQSSVLKASSSTPCSSPTSSAHVLVIAS
jgi:Alternative oxidase